MMLSSFLILISLSPGSPVDDLYPAVVAIARNEAAGAPGFVRFGAGGNDQPNSITYSVSVRRGNRDTLRVVAHKVRTEELADRLWFLLQPSTRTSEPELGFSGLPIGTKTRRIVGRGSTSLQAIDGLFASDIIITFPSPPVTIESDKDLIEGIARRTLSRYRGLQSQGAAGMTLNGTSVGSVIGPRGERLVDLTRYCQAYNLQLNTNQVLGTAGFTAGGEQVIIPLAAKRVKDGARWIDTTDISVIKDDKWYVSYAALQNARGH